MAIQETHSLPLSPFFASGLFWPVKMRIGLLGERGHLPSRMLCMFWHQKWRELLPCRGRKGVEEGRADRQEINKEILPSYDLINLGQCENGKGRNGAEEEEEMEESGHCYRRRKKCC